ncbi:MAG: peptidase [Sphingobacterium sp.]|nr:peptidase [Sphingobacterium sp.]
MNFLKKIRCTYLCPDRSAWRFLLVITMILAFAQTYGQWKSFNFVTEKQNEVSLLPSKRFMTDGYTFFSSSDEFNEDVRTFGFEPFKKKSIWINPINENFSIDAKTIYLNLYTKNVKTIILNIRMLNGEYYQKRINFASDGYQVPFEWSPEHTNKIEKLPDFYSDLTNVKSKSLFFASVELRDDKQPFQLILGDAKIYKRYSRKLPSQGHFFYEITGEKKNILEDDVRKKFGDGHPFIQYANFTSFNGSPYSFEYKSESLDSIEIQSYTLELIQKIFEKYTFYDEHGLNKGKILQKIHEIVNSNLPFANKINQIETEGKKLHDGHFYFKNPSNGLTDVSSPLILKRIQDHVQVVGIRDDRLESKISLGDIIYSIDKIESERYIDSLSVNYFGNSKQRKELAISHLLERTLNSVPSEIVLRKTDGSFYQVELAYDKKFPAPKKFIPLHFGFKRLPNNWAYLKINKWDKGDWIKFLNFKDSIKNSNGIVLDLRGNPGGIELESIKIASCFIKKPLLYAEQRYKFLQKEIVGQTIIKPNRFLDLSKLSIIILVDNKTACASESFALTLKKNANVTIVGSSPTSGAYSTVYSFTLPFKIELWMNILSKTYFLDEKIVLEYNAIRPDVQVDITKYTDLYGYDDKVLSAAKNLIDRSIYN